MTKKHLDKLLSEVSGLADRLSEVDDALSPTELEEQLRDTGIDPEVLRRRLHEGVGDIVARLGAAGKPVPRYLMQVSDATAPLEEVGRLSTKAAVERLRGWVRGIRDRASAPMAPMGQESLAVLRAYRQTGDLTPKDAQLLDELETQLKARAKGGSGGGTTRE